MSDDEANYAMPKRRRSSGATAPRGTTFSLMDGGVDVLEGLVLHTDVITEEFEEELISFVQAQCARGRKGELKKQAYIRPSGKRSQGEDMHLQIKHCEDREFESHSCVNVLTSSQETNARRSCLAVSSTSIWRDQGNADLCPPSRPFSNGPSVA